MMPKMLVVQQKFRKIYKCANSKKKLEIAQFLLK